MWHSLILPIKANKKLGKKILKPSFLQFAPKKIFIWVFLQNDVKF
ncbi:Hypothetical protein Mbov_0402 [Mycoplasmopsis bovis HB0801]|uniref:Uncharacterized protein n=1 Tax=Mycoplasmopsis bovis (strain ATCC 25523 / DSM 22781 / NCTC 10131 / PG45) TaxID=289397 RepID=A0A454APL4_MYCBG|nr:hypothetical protein MBOVPG45_0478 [Mycoplasmopsis bovis PG45]AFM51759.2 Hypothetical protein Mbov_0402 [Mycoplasmopsis bovis HB0801]